MTKEEYTTEELKEAFAWYVFQIHLLSRRASASSLFNEDTMLHLNLMIVNTDELTRILTGGALPRHCSLSMRELAEALEKAARDE